MTQAVTTRGGLARILVAAERCFVERGYGGTSISEIATAARTSKATVFHHFRSKEDLYIGVLRAAADKFDMQMAAAVSASTTFDEQIEGFMARHLQQMLRRPRSSRLLLREVTEGGDKRNKRLANRVLGANFARLVELLQAAQIANLVRRDIDCAAAACLLIGANVFYFQSRHLLAHFPSVSFANDPHAYALQGARIVLKGILVEDA